MIDQREPIRAVLLSAPVLEREWVNGDVDARPAFAATLDHFGHSPIRSVRRFGDLSTKEREENIIAKNVEVEDTMTDLSQMASLRSAHNCTPHELTPHEAALKQIDKQAKKTRDSVECAIIHN